MPRVYFCSDLTGFHLYFRAICSDIFAAQDNCAIYYEEDSVTAYDEIERFALLAEIQLFVVPITKQVLKSPSRAVDIELPFAHSKHIPILPIMVEEGGIDNLIDEFNQTAVFSGIQFLNKYDKDRTAIQ